jgi:multidrug efflux pump
MDRFLSNPRVLVLFIAVIIVAGLSALSTLPRTEDPRIANRFGTVLVSFPGASAERVEALITEVLENKLREIPEIEHIDSSSRAGLCSMSIQLADAVTATQTDEVWAEIRDKLKESEPLLPSASAPPFLDDQRSDAYTMIVALTWQGAGEHDLMVLGRYAREIESRLRAVDGTDFIKIHGQPEEEIHIAVNSGQAALLGLDVASVGRAVVASDAKVSAGELNNEYQRLAVEVSGALDTVDRIRQIPLLVGESGAAVRVGDIAEVSRAARQPIKKQAVVAGKPSVVVAIRMLPHQRGDLWVERIHQELDRVEQVLPKNIELSILFDQQDYTSQRLGELIRSIVIGFLLIALILWLTLGWRSALIVAASLPLTVLFALACMSFIGLPIHQISVTGLIVSLGIMVDNAIVMADTVARYKREGQSGLRATYSAVQHLWRPLMGSTLTTILAFMPLVLMEGPAGEFMAGISFTVIFSLSGSYLVSHIIVAGLSGRYLKRDPGNHWMQRGLEFPRLAAQFTQSLRWTALHPRRVIFLVVLLPLMGYWLGAKLPQSFFPASDRNMFNFEVYLPTSASLYSTKALTEQISEELSEIEGIESLHWFVGGNAPSFYYNMMQHHDGAQYYAQAMITTDHFSTANKLVPELQKRLDDRFLGAQIILRRLEQGPASPAPVVLRLVGSDLQKLKSLGNQLRKTISSVQDVVHVRDTLSDAVPKLWVDIDEHTARSVGLSLSDTAEQLRSGIDGVVMGSVLEDTQSLPVRVDMAGYQRSKTQELTSWLLVPGNNVGISNATASGLPLSALGEVTLRPERGVIPRRDGERVNVIETYIRDGVLPAVVLSRVQQQLQLQPLELPAGYRLEIAGDNENRDRAVRKLMASVGLIAVLLVIAVVMSFNSFRLSLIIFIVGGLSAGLGMLGLVVVNSPFGLTSIIGMMALVGLAINASIVILAQLKSDRLAVQGDVEAIVKAVTHCSRHIVSTTVTTVMGFMPLMLGGGGFWPPFAVVIAGGTLLTTMLSFYLAPALFSLMVKLRPFEVGDELAVPAT